MKNSLISLDLERLECVRHSDQKIVAKCPACAADGHDNKGEHLAIYQNGAYVCIAHPRDKEHNSKIFSLVGIRGKMDRNAVRKWLGKKESDEIKLAASSRLKTKAAAQTYRDAILKIFPWSLEEMFKDSPQQLYSPASRFQRDPRLFLASLFDPNALLWTGKKEESGCGGLYADHWRPNHVWCSTPIWQRVGPMVSPAIWKQGTVSRSRTEIARAPYVVIDFDGFDGVKPLQVLPHLLSSLAIIRWLRENQFWRLAAILWTGNKSLHAWFHSPPEHIVDSLRTVAEPFGMDKGLIGHPEHPCRLPGHRHEKTGIPSSIFWLQTPPSQP